MSAFADAYKAAMEPPAEDEGSEAPVILGSPNSGGGPVDEVNGYRPEPGWRPPRSKSIGEAVARHYGTTN